MNKKDFNNISIRGRIAYAIVCVKNFLGTNKDYTILMNKLWDIVDGDAPIDIEANRFMEVIPEYLFEFSTFEESEFEYLSKEEYESFRLLLTNSTNELNAMLHKIYDMVMSYAYTGVEEHAPMVTDRLFEIIDILTRNKIKLPSISDFSDLPFDVADGWGNLVDRNKYTQ